MIKLLRAMVAGATTAVIWVWTVLFARGTLGASILDRLKAARRGFTPDEWVLFGLRRGNTRQYIAWGQTVRARELNVPFSLILDDVVVCHETMSHLLPTQQIFACVGANGIIASRRADLACADDVFWLLDRHDIVLKWVDGSLPETRKAKPVWLVRQRDGKLLLDQQPVTREQIMSLLRRLDGYCLAEHIEPHPYASRWGSPPAVELEIVIARDPAVETICAVQHFGQTASGVRWAAPVDLATGVLGAARSAGQWGEIALYDDDPSAAIAGVTVPGWAGIRRAVEEAAGELRFFRLMTFRVVVTADGFVLTGASSSADTTTMQLWGGLADSTLGRLLGAGS